MALVTPTWLQNGTYTARLDRIFSTVMFTEGVMRPGAGQLLVTQRGAGANNSVDIAAGYACITGDDAAGQGNYLVYNDGVVNLAATAAPVANSRIDLVCVRINDPAEGGPAGDNATFVYVTGVAAASPTPPATPTSAIALARVLRTVGDTSVVTANITDVRPQSLTFFSNTLTNAGDLLSFDGANLVRIALGSTGLPLVAGATSVGYAQVGTAGIADTAVTLGKLAANSVDSSKIVDASITGSDIASATLTNSLLSTASGELGGAWTTYAPVLVQSGPVAATVNRATYMRIGRTIHFQVSLSVTGSGSAGSAVTVSLPVTAASSGFMIPGGGHIGDSSAATNYPGLTWLQSTTSVVLFAAAVTSGTLAYPLGQTSFTAALAAGDAVTVAGTYEAA
jgi:hypothetical protein